MTLGPDIFIQWTSSFNITRWVGSSSTIIPMIRLDVWTSCSMQKMILSKKLPSKHVISSTQPCYKTNCNMLNEYIRCCCCCWFVRMFCTCSREALWAICRALGAHYVIIRNGIIHASTCEGRVHRSISKLMILLVPMHYNGHSSNAQSIKYMKSKSNGVIAWLARILHRYHE